jgi:ribonuclease-3
VTHEQLAQIADRLGLRKYILLSVGQSRTISADSKENKHLLVTALKAVFGAIFFEKGIEKLNEVIDRIFKISSLKTPSRFLDPKNDLHVLAQNQYHAIPSYQETNVWGLPHERRFEIAVFIRTTKIGTGVGCSKKEAEKAAAQNALETKSTWEKTLK